MQWNDLRVIELNGGPVTKYPISVTFRMALNILDALSTPSATDSDKHPAVCF